MKLFLIFPFGLFLLFAVNLGAQPLLEPQSDQNVRVSCECIDSEEESIDTVHFTSGAYFLLDNDQIQRIVKVLYHNKVENNWYIYDSENNKIVFNLDKMPLKFKRLIPSFPAQCKKYGFATQISLN